MVDDDFKAPVLLSEFMTRFALIQNGDEQSVLFMRLSHAQYDGVSLERMKSNLENAYNGLRLLPGPKFVDYFHFANTSAAETFWTEYLKGSKMTQLVNHQGPAYRNIFDYLLERRIPARTLRHRGITDASLAKAAWAYTPSAFDRQSGSCFRGAYIWAKAPLSWRKVTSTVGNP
ncbi:hypothetical protein V8C34DRAFT_295775 [Trichoderma compactum]